MKKKRMREILTAAREKVRSGWCQHTFAVDKQGVAVTTDSPCATNFCATGAISAVGVTHEEYEESVSILRSNLPRYAGDCISVQMFNDSRKTTRLKILGVFGRAIASLETA